MYLKGKNQHNEVEILKIVKFGLFLQNRFSLFMPYKIGRLTIYEGELTGMHLWGLLVTKFTMKVNAF